MKLTDAQKKLEREYKRMLSVVESASKGQYLIKPNANGYTEAQHKLYAEYQKRIDAANSRIAELKIIASAQSIPRQ